MRIRRLHFVVQNIHWWPVQPDHVNSHLVITELSIYCLYFIFKLRRITNRIQSSTFKQVYIQLKFVYDICNKYHYCINRKVAPYHNKKRYKSSFCVFNNVMLEVLMNFLDLSCRNVYLDSKENLISQCLQHYWRLKLAS